MEFFFTFVCENTTNLMSKHPVSLEEKIRQQCNLLAERLQTVSSDDVPEKPYYYTAIGNLYYAFKDYQKSITYFQSALDEVENAANQWHRLGALLNTGQSGKTILKIIFQHKSQSKNMLHFTHCNILFPLSIYFCVRKTKRFFGFY